MILVVCLIAGVLLLGLVAAYVYGMIRFDIAMWGPKRRTGDIEDLANRLHHSVTESTPHGSDPQRPSPPAGGETRESGA